MGLQPRDGLGGVSTHPDDLLVFDDTYGVVPKGVLKQWNQKAEGELLRSSSRSRLSGYDEDEYESDEQGWTRSRAVGGDLSGMGGGSTKSLPPVRY